MDAKKIGKAIAFLRKFYGMTQKQLAMKMNVTDKAVSRWERGMGTPDISLLNKLAQILDVDIESLLVGNLTHFEINWKGILCLNYPEGLAADTMIYDKRIVYFQLGLFLLVGIREIYLQGKKHDINFVKEELGDGSDIGIQLVYEETEDNYSDNVFKKVFAEYNAAGGVMLIKAPSFIYGKDLTKTFRRIIYDSESAVKLLSFKGEDLGIRFYPQNNSQKQARQILERGVISFPLKGVEEVLDASMLLKILEKYQGEKIGDLKEIAIKRSMVQR